MDITPHLLYYKVGESVTAFSTTRKSGLSKGAYSAFNITHYCGDDAQAVAANRNLLCTMLGIDENRLILPRQIHGTVCRCIDNDYFALSQEVRSSFLDGADAVITNLPHVCIGVSTADCVPILLYDASKRIAAAIHAGWRGTVARILEKTIKTMQNKYSVHPGDLTAVIAPSISLDAFEVGNEVYDTFLSARFPMERIACKYGEKWHIDLWETNRLQLLSCGVSEHKIQLSGICTYSHCDEFFSARRLGIESGRIFTGIIMG